MKKLNDVPFALASQDTKDRKNQKAVAAFDKMDLKVFAECLASHITACETPMTVGLQGDWGTGKTSLMNMIKCYISDDTCHMVDVNTWHYSMFRQDEYLGIVVIQALIDQLVERFAGRPSRTAEALRQVSESLGTALRAAGRVGKAVSISLPGVSVPVGALGQIIQEADDAPKIENLSAVMLSFKKQFSEIIQEHVADHGKRIVFFIDDLDRIRPIKAVEVLETLKNFMDVDGCVFVLAVDYEIVQLGIAEKFGKDIQITSGKSFFDKIIQLPFRMPVSSYSLDEYLGDLLATSKFYNYDWKTNDADRNFFVDITEVTVGRNPRSIKRAVNYASLLERIRKSRATNESKKSRSTTKLLYAAVCMQIAWPELFEYFVLRPTAETIRGLENWDTLDSLPHARRLFARVGDVDEVKDNIAAFFDTLYGALDVKANAGTLTAEEIAPLLDVLKLVSLTSEKLITRSANQLDDFEKKLSANASGQPGLVKFFAEVYRKSYWVTNEEFEYKQTSSRYFTIIWRRRQIGSLVTLKGRPFVMRLKEPRAALLRALEAGPAADICRRVVRDLDNADSLTGIGDTEVDIVALSRETDDAVVRQVLNLIGMAVVNAMAPAAESADFHRIDHN